MTVIVVFDIFGNCRIGNPNIALSPTSRIRRLTTSAKTGRLMKMSVKRMALALLGGCVANRYPHPPFGHPLPLAGEGGDPAGDRRVRVWAGKITCGVGLAGGAGGGSPVTVTTEPFCI